MKNPFETEYKTVSFDSDKLVLKDLSKKIIIEIFILWNSCFLGSSKNKIPASQ